MRSSTSIIRSTALEILSEPLSLLVLLAAQALTVLAPAFHYHQFGEATRMARDAGLSSLFTCGCIVAVFGTIRAFRREVESGTLQMALAHPISRTAFFLSKCLGAMAAYALFCAVVLLTACVIVDGAAMGGAIAARTGDIARIWGPSLAMGVGDLILPMFIAAALNRFARFRFVLSSFVLALVLSAASAVLAFVHDWLTAARLVSAAVPIMVLGGILLSAAAAFAVRLRANAAASAAGVVFLLLVPAIGNYYLSDELSGGGAVPWPYVGLSALCAVPAVLLFLFLGIQFINGRDVT